MTGRGAGRAGRRALRAAFAGGAWLGLSACGGAAVRSDAAAGAAARAGPLGEPEVRAIADRPALAVLRREGDPRAGVAMAVAVDGPAGASEALAALLEGRLAAALPRAAVTADRRGVRVHTSLDGEVDLDRALAALRRAMAEPVGGAEDVAAVLGRLRARRSRVIDDDGAVALARCTGEARYAEAELAAIESSVAAPDGLERWRRRAYGAGAVAFGLTGPERLARRAEARLRAAPAWPRVAPSREPWPAQAPSEQRVRTGREPVARVDVAWRVADRQLATSVAEELGLRPSSLSARLRAMPLPFALREVGVSVGPTGACLSLRAEAQHAAASGGTLPEEAGAVAGLLRHEIGALGARGRGDDGAFRRQLSAVGDARQAAEAVAWWALSDEGPARAPPTFTAVATLPAADAATARAALGGLATTKAPASAAPETTKAPAGPEATKAPAAAGLEATKGPDEDPASGDVGKRFADAMARALAGWSRPAVEVRGAIEPGQGELWLLLASPCPLGENAAEAGTTALGATAVALASPRDGGVTVEPWASAEGAGVLAHAPPAPGESAAALAERVATAAARAIVELEPGPDEITRARSLLLAQAEGRDEHVRGALAEQLLPSHAGAWFPWGLAGPLGRASPEAVRVRWRRLAAGPLRLAVLAGGGPEQVRTAASAVERWASRGDAAARCPPREDVPEPGVGRRAAVALGAQGTRAYLALPTEASTPAARAALRATLLLLGPAGGVLARALGGLGARGEAFLLGREPRPLLAIELRGSDEVLEAAVPQVRALLERLRRGAVGPGELDRVRAPLRVAWLDARSSPRRRLLDLWRGAGDESAAPSLEAWRQWLGSGFFDERAAVVVVKAPGE